MNLEQWCLSHPNYVVHADDPAWQERRSKVVTGTGVASLMGLSPWRGREALLDSYLRSVPFSDNHRTFWGRQLEGAVMQGYASLVGLRIVNANAYFERESIGSTIDGLVDPESLDGLLSASEGYVGTTAPSYWRAGVEKIQYLLGREEPVICEIKVTSERNKSEWGKEVPRHYWAQLQAQMYVTGLDTAIIVAKIGAYDVRHHVVEQDASFQSRMLEEAAEFLKEVENGRNL